MVAIMVVAAVIGWFAGVQYWPDLTAGRSSASWPALVAAYATYFVVVRPIQRSRAIPREEKEIFILTATLLWGIMIQGA